MKRGVLHFLLLVSVLAVTAQRTSITDSLTSLLAASKQDTNRVMLLKTLAQFHHRANPSMAMQLLREGQALAHQLKFAKGEAECLLTESIILEQEGSYPSSLERLLQSKNISSRINDAGLSSRIMRAQGKLYASQGNYGEAKNYLFQAKLIQERMHDKSLLATTLKIIGETYFEQNFLDSAWFFLSQSYQMLEDKNEVALNDLLTGLGQVQVKMGNDARALGYFRNSVPYSMADNDQTILTEAYLGIANLLKKSGQADSCIYYALEGLEAAQKINYSKGILASSQLLSELYEPVNEHEAFRYYKMATAVKDSVFNTVKARQVQNLDFVERQRLQSIEANKLEYQNKIKVYALLSALGMFLLLVLFLWRNNRNKLNAKIKIEKAYEDLKTTQAQLIQSEKMASLGELTAGIAHEIQNPLNFVNNFSEVSVELVDDLKGERSKVNGERNEELENEILDDLSENLVKITHHGKRADAIVKGMLQHSRASSGKKEPTDINALAIEHLRLSYHGLRAKDKDFNVNFITDFDESIGKIEVVPQDIGRVLLNLYNNAFYAAPLLPEGAFKGPFYKHEPTVWVTTSKIPPSRGGGAWVSISVRDNGPGIPSKVVDKIFQPFFTTKPTGQGTGLGLSMSYDIIKAHGGELNVESKEGEGAEFIVQLPTA